MKRMNDRKLRFTSRSDGLTQASAPSFSRYRSSRLFSGTVSTCTKITATPSPSAVSTFFEQARNEHMPRKYASAMFSRNTDRMPRLRKCSIWSVRSVLFLQLRLPSAQRPDQQPDQEQRRRRQQHQPVRHVPAAVLGQRQHGEPEDLAGAQELAGQRH